MEVEMIVYRKGEHEYPVRLFFCKRCDKKFPRMSRFNRVCLKCQKPKGTPKVENKTLCEVYKGQKDLNTDTYK